MGTTSTFPTITNRQQDLLRLIYKFRFLNRVQIQALMGHKDKHLINVWLKDLTLKNYLVQQYSKTFPDNTKPAVYVTDTMAIRYFKSLSKPDVVIQRLYRDRKATNAFIQSKLLLADVTIELDKSSTDTTKFDLATSSDFGNPEAMAYFFHRLEYSPDAVMTRTDMVEKTTDSYLIQLFPANYPTKLRYSKIRFYLDFYADDDWERYTGMTAHEYVFIFFSYSQLLSTKRYLIRLLGKDYVRIYDFPVKFLLATNIQKFGFIKTFDSTDYLKNE